MFVQFGNDNAIEGFRDPTSDDPELVRYREAEGQRVTTITFPEGVSLNEAFQTSLTSLTYHIAQDASPAWVESDNESLQSLLMEHFGLTKSKASRPKNWAGDDDAVGFAPPTTEGDDA
jgi:hypothetical protein